MKPERRAARVSWCALERCEQHVSLLGFALVSAILGGRGLSYKRLHCSTKIRYQEYLFTDYFDILHFCVSCVAYGVSDS